MTRARELADLGKQGGISVGTSAPGSTGGYMIGVGLSAGGSPSRQLDVASGDCVVGSAITFGGNSGIVSATAFHGDGSSLSGTDPAGINTAGFSTFTQIAASGIVTVTNTTASTSATTGALIVSGGVGVSKKLNVGDTTDSTSTTTGSVVISGGVGIAKSLFVGGQLSVGGTITYDDVTNVDSVGIVTAGKGVRVTTGGIHVVAGVSTLGGGSSMADNVSSYWGTGADLQVFSDGDNGVLKGLNGRIYLQSDSGINLTRLGNAETFGVFHANSGVDLYHDNSKKFSTVGTGVSIFGGMKVQSGLLRENVKITAGKLSANLTINTDNGMVHYFTTQESAQSIPNIISGAGINTDMAIGDTMTISVLTTAHANSFPINWRIDGVEASAGVTTYWNGGSAPSSGNSSGVDFYTLNFVKTASARYTAFANVSNFA